MSTRPPPPPSFSKLCFTPLLRCTFCTLSPLYPHLSATIYSKYPSIQVHYTTRLLSLLFLVFVLNVPTAATATFLRFLNYFHSLFCLWPCSSCIYFISSFSFITPTPQLFYFQGLRFFSPFKCLCEPPSSLHISLPSVIQYFFSHSPTGFFSLTRGSLHQTPTLLFASWRFHLEFVSFSNINFPFSCFRHSVALTSGGLWR